MTDLTHVPVPEPVHWTSPGALDQDTVRDLGPTALETLLAREWVVHAADSVRGGSCGFGERHPSAEAAEEAIGRLAAHPEHARYDRWEVVRFDTVVRGIPEPGAWERPPSKEAKRP